MKKAMLRTLTATCILIALLATASCGKNNDAEQNHDNINQTTTTTEDIKIAVPELMADAETVTATGYYWEDGKGLWMLDENGEEFLLEYAEGQTYPLFDEQGNALALSALGTGSRVKIGRAVNAEMGIETIVRMEKLEHDRDTSRMHGIIKAIEQDCLLVYFGKCDDVSTVDDAACTYVPVTGVPIVSDNLLEPRCGLENMEVGNYVFVSGVAEKKAGGSGRMLYHDVYSVTVCPKIVKQYTVGYSPNADEYIMVGGCKVSRSFFEAGNVFENGEPVSFNSIKEGDVLEVVYNGEILTSMPGQFGHIDIIRVVSRAGN